jgi:hypothetical protein
MVNNDISKEEKLNIISSRIRSVRIDRFNAELNVIEQNALETPQATIVSSANKIIANADAQITALQAQYTAIESE